MHFLMSNLELPSNVDPSYFRSCKLLLVLARKRILAEPITSDRIGGSWILRNRSRRVVVQSLPNAGGLYAAHSDAIWTAWLSDCNADFCEKQIMHITARNPRTNSFSRWGVGGKLMKMTDGTSLRRRFFHLTSYFPRSFPTLGASVRDGIKAWFSCYCYVSAWLW